MARQRFIGTDAAAAQRKIEVVGLDGEGRYQVTVDDVPHEVDARRFEHGNWSVIIDGQSYDVELEPQGSPQDGRYNALVRGQVFTIGVVDERRLRMEQTTKKLKVAGPKKLPAPMPGKVVKLLVKEGDEVVEDQPLLIIEAMKMENDIFAPAKGKIVKIFVEPGQAVEANAPLLELE